MGMVVFFRSNRVLWRNASRQRILRTRLRISCDWRVLIWLLAAHMQTPREVVSIGIGYQSAWELNKPSTAREYMIAAKVPMQVRYQSNA
jgi:hypothetical protein